MENVGLNLVEQIPLRHKDNFLYYAYINSFTLHGRFNFRSTAQ